ncbi:MAG: YihA family ribosome biogenesis GTP-binding protein [Alphaproteobacteria bacterium]|nr:YihA family ribosome biogenesis GTP-binding protein [Alphaproteobacteria bacterium]
MDDHEAHGRAILIGDTAGARDGTPDLDAGRRLFAGECAFVLAAASVTQLPDGDMPEIAFAGRSNVGKSSLVNALTGRGTLARASNTPGRTQQLIFFRLAGRLMLVDLPGYGFAKAPKDVVRQWHGLINDYLRGRPVLRRALVLVDSRHGLKDNDRDVMKMLDVAAVNYQLVLTKVDKITPAQALRCRAAVAAEVAAHTAAYPEVLLTSAEKGTGIAELRAALAEIAAPPAS